MVKEKLDRLIEFATASRFSDEVLKAKKEYEEMAGEIFADDPSYENRMAGFLEWYVFDRVLPDKELSPLELYIQENQIQESAEGVDVFRDFRGFVHALFAAKRIRAGTVTVMNLFDQKKYTILTGQAGLMIQKNDVFEARLLPRGEGYYFSEAFCFHPPKSLKFIKGEIGKIAARLKSGGEQIKKFKKELKGSEGKIAKSRSRIEKLRNKIAASKSARDSWTIELSEMEASRVDLENLKLDLESKIADWEKKVLDQDRRDRDLLMRRLRYMNLKWERYRNFSIDDLYRN